MFCTTCTLYVLGPAVNQTGRPTDRETGRRIIHPPPRSEWSYCSGSQWVRKTDRHSLWAQRTNCSSAECVCVCVCVQWLLLGGGVRGKIKKRDTILFFSLSFSICIWFSPAGMLNGSLRSNNVRPAILWQAFHSVSWHSGFRVLMPLSFKHKPGPSV